MGKTDWRSSKSLVHDWNEVYADGSWVIEDTTFDATLGSTKYFDPTPEDFANDHVKLATLSR